MRFPWVITAALLLLCGFIRTVAAQTGGPPLTRSLGDSSLRLPLIVPGIHSPLPMRFTVKPNATSRHVPEVRSTVTRTIRCPMPVFTADTSGQDRMPIVRPDTTVVDRMPVMHEACVNPLWARTPPH